MIRIFYNELRKYATPIVLGLLSFYLIIFFILTLLMFRIESLNIDDSYKVMNKYFSTFFISVLPITLIIYLNTEFSVGYVGKLISNGLSRQKYLKYKFLFFFQLSVLTSILYFTSFSLFALFFPSLYIDNHLFRSIILIFVMTNCTLAIAAFFIILFRSLVLSFFLFYVYISIDTILFEEKKWLFPIGYLKSCFINIFSLTNPEFLVALIYLLVIILVLWFIIYQFFKRVDL